MLPSPLCSRIVVFNFTFIQIDEKSSVITLGVLMGVLWLPLGWLLALWVLLGVLLGLSGCFLRAPSGYWVLVGFLGGDSVSPGDPLVVSWAGLGASWVFPWWLLGFFRLLAALQARTVVFQRRRSSTKCSVFTT